MRRQTSILFSRDPDRTVRLILWCARLGLGFYLERVAPGFALVHIATREGAEIAHRTSALPLYTFP